MERDIDGFYRFKGKGSYDMPILERRSNAGTARLDEGWI